ncbi:YqaA family protein [Maribrevibacterium harenarium]|uniref:YqaA family protein n=1 Tax=Maribrevibacterium harenarium TaxID=2589817 RepID=UPI001C6113AF|nr:YqaA family protein [Maribrevibacterium harenarium]
MSATLLPMGSEAYLGYLTSEYSSLWMVWLGVAAAGNTLGGVTNWWLGVWSHRFEGSRFYPSPSQLNYAQGFYRRYGALTLLFSWLPVVGDVFCVCAGLCHYPLRRFLIYVFLGKFVRYAFVVIGVLSVTGQ